MTLRSPKSIAKRAAITLLCVVACLALGAWAAIQFVPLPESLNHVTPATLTLLDTHGREIVELPSVAARAQAPVST